MVTGAGRWPESGEAIDCFGVLVAEVMLQQTQLAVVLPYWPLPPLLVRGRQNRHFTTLPEANPGSQLPHCVVGNTTRSILWVNFDKLLWVGSFILVGDKLAKTTSLMHH
jgi:hypothetical protein